MPEAGDHRSASGTGTQNAQQPQLNMRVIFRKRGECCWCELLPVDSTDSAEIVMRKLLAKHNAHSNRLARALRDATDLFLWQRKAVFIAQLRPMTHVTWTRQADIGDGSFPGIAFLERITYSEPLTQAFHNPDDCQSIFRCQGLPELHRAVELPAFLTTETTEALLVSHRLDRSTAYAFFIAWILVAVALGSMAGAVAKSFDTGVAMGSSFWAVVSGLQSLLAWRHQV